MKKMCPLCFMIFCLMFILIPASAPATVKTTLPSVFIEKMDEIPDITQTDPAARFPHGGGHFCGPAAASNSLAWLADQGYRKLVQDVDGRSMSQAELAKLIGSREYMDTTLDNGTSPGDILIGFDKYIRDCGFRYRRLEYQGWRRHPREFSTGVSVPDLNWIKKGLLGDSGVLLNVGWYTYDPQADRYRRLSGHWVTLVGYGVDEHGRHDPNVIVIHDPAPRTGMNFGNEFVRLERIRRGAISGVGMTRSAEGYFIMGGGMHIKNGADYAILDGAIILEMDGSSGKAGS